MPVLEGEYQSSHPREPPPQVLTEPDVNLSAHPALPIEACPHSNGQCANNLVSLRATRASQWLARRRWPRSRLCFRVSHNTSLRSICLSVGYSADL